MLENDDGQAYRTRKLVAGRRHAASGMLSGVRYLRLACLVTVPFMRHMMQVAKCHRQGEGIG